MRALLRIRIVETGKVEPVLNENCKLRPHAIAVSDEGGEAAKKGDAAALRPRATEGGANVAVLRGDQNKPVRTMKRSSQTKKPGSLPRRRPQKGARKVHQGKQVEFQTRRT